MLSVVARRMLFSGRDSVVCDKCFGILRVACFFALVMLAMSAHACVNVYMHHVSDLIGHDNQKGVRDTSFQVL